MKAISDALRVAIESLRKRRDDNTQPTWELRIYRDRERMLGIIEGAQITSGPDQDIQPAIAQADTGAYHVAFGRGGTIYEMVSSQTNVPSVTWGAPTAQFAGEDPDLEYDGFFDTVGHFTPTTLMMVYEQPTGTLKFRRKSGGTWGSAVTVASGTNPSLCRGWADPPALGEGDDTGLLVAYTQGGDLFYVHSDDDGSTWSDPISIDSPPGGTKRNAQIFRLADYTHGIIYEYDNGLNSEVWFLKSTRRYVNIASPDEVFRSGSGGYRHFTWNLFQVTIADHTIDTGAGGYMTYDWSLDTADGGQETFEAGSGGYRQVTFTGVEP